MSLSIRSSMNGGIPDEIVGFRLSKDDYLLVREEMRRHGLNKSQFFRMLVAGYFAYRATAINSLDGNNNVETSVS